MPISPLEKSVIKTLLSLQEKFAVTLYVISFPILSLQPAEVSIPKLFTLPKFSVGIAVPIRIEGDEVRLDSILERLSINPSKETESLFS